MTAAPTLFAFSLIDISEAFADETDDDDEAEAETLEPASLSAGAFSNLIESRAWLARIVAS